MADRKRRRKVLAERPDRAEKPRLQDILIACADGLKGFPAAINCVYPQTHIQLCIIHMVRNSSLEELQGGYQRAEVYQAPTKMRCWCRLIRSQMYGMTNIRKSAKAGARTGKI
ncbi:hypothetical protein ACN68_27875 [Escherichia coli]|nr:hypothetical protein ACN68_27875 [Escherichia coli]OKT92660.1 hypothetical protein ACN69_00085 [Escherichia coli]OKU10007.1 hypothetical protein ACN77_19520 [Escherichia coli]